MPTRTHSTPQNSIIFASSVKIRHCTESHFWPEKLTIKYVLFCLVEEEFNIKFSLANKPVKNSRACPEIQHQDVGKRTQVFYKHILYNQRNRTSSHWIKHTAFWLQHLLSLLKRIKRGQENWKLDLEMGNEDARALHLRLKVKNQRCILQSHWVATDCVINDLCRCEGRLSPVKVDRRWSVSFGIEMVRGRGWWHHAITDSFKKEKTAA